MMKQVNFVTAMIMGMCMHACCMCMASCTPKSHMFSISEGTHRAA